MAAFRLDVELATNPSLDSFKKEINRIADELSTGIKPVQIKLDFDDTKLKNIRSEISNISGAISAANSLNINLGLGSNPAQQMAAVGRSARSAIAELKSQAQQLEAIFANYYKMADGASAVAKGISQSGGDMVKYFNTMNVALDSGASLQSQVAAWKEYIDLMRQAANIQGIDVSSVTSGFSRSADEIFNATQKVATGEQQMDGALSKMKSLFGGGTDVSGIVGQLSGIQETLSGINQILSEINSNTSGLTGLNSTINNLAGSVKNVKDEATGAAAEIQKVNESTSQSTSSSSATSLRQIIDTYNQMQRLILSAPTGAQGTSEFDRLVSVAGQFKSIINACNGDANALAGALSSAGQDGSAAIESARLAMSNYKTVLNEAQAAAKAEAEAAKESAQTAKEKAKADKDAEKAAKDKAKADKDAEKAAKDKAKANKDAAKAEDDANAALKRAEVALRSWTAAENSSKDSSREAYAAIREKAEALRSAITSYDGTAQSAERLKSAIDQMNSTMKESGRVIAANGDDTKKLSDRFGSLTQKFGMWFSASHLIMLAVRSVRQMITESIELNSAMTQMQIVTKASSSEMEAFADSAAKSANRTATSIKDIVSSATTYARLGYNTDESTRLSEYTSMLQNVGDIDVADAQNAVTSIIKAFDVDIGQIESVMDKLVVVGK